MSAPPPRPGAAPRRGDVYWVVLDPTFGSKIQKTRPCIIVSNESMNRYGKRVIARPCIIVSNDSMNRYGKRVIVVPLTSKTAQLYPTEVLVTRNDQESKAVCDQIRTVDKGRLRAKLDTLAAKDFHALETALRITLGLALD